ncbi:PulJ/GspJ family protein [Thermotoga profunda]|uniref:PulJ/GspJ family protein n=1 Tax=Thermotoga profunda TaxID=1508420 RepID=UPI000596B773|nr:hypothetical protein [Thermotoga profunda]
MKGFTVIELVVVLILIFIVTGISVFIYNQITRNSEILIQKTNVQEQLAKIDSTLRREILKAGPTVDGLSVQSNLVTFVATVPFSKGVYGVYGSAAKLLYSLNFSNGVLVLNIQEIGGSYSKSMQIGQLDECAFSSPDTGIISYTLGKSIGTKSYKLHSCVVLSNIK